MLNPIPNPIVAPAPITAQAPAAPQTLVLAPAPVMAQTLVLTPTPAVAQPNQNLFSGSASAFSPAAVTEVQKSTDDFIDALTNEASRIAHRAKADTVSAAHVEQAATTLVSLPYHSKYKHFGTAGGLFLGTALSQLVAMIADNDPHFSIFGVTITCAFGIVPVPLA